MKVVNMHEAKTTLSQLVEMVERGEEVVIARAGTPVAKLVPVVDAKKQPRVLGQWKGKVRMSDDFDAPMSEEELALWEGTGKDES